VLTVDQESILRMLAERVDAVPRRIDVKGPRERAFSLM